MGQRIVGVEWSPDGLKLALLDAQLRRTSLVGVATLKWTDEQSLADKQQLIAQVLQGPVDVVVASAPSLSVSMRSMQFPFQDVRKLEQAILFELEGQLPVDTSVIVFSFLPWAREKQGMEVLTAWSQQGAIGQAIATLEPLGLEPQALIHPALALLPWLKDAPGCRAVLSWQHDRFDLLIGQGSQPYWARTVPLGGGWLIAAMAKHFEMTVEAAEQALLTQQCWWPASEQQRDGVLAKQSQQMEQLLAPLIGQLGLTFARLPPAQRPVELVLLGKYGGMIELPGLLEQQLGLPASYQTHAAVAEQLELVTEPSPDASYTTPLGLAMLRLSLSGREIPLNMRQGPFAYEGNFSRYRTTVVRAVVGICLVGLLSLGSSMLQWWLLRQEDRMLTDGVCQASKQLIGQEICQPERALAVLQSSTGMVGMSLPMFSASRILEMMSKLLPAEFDVVFEELDIRLEGAQGQSDRIQGKGEASSFETAEQLVSMLQKDPCVEDAEVSRLRKGQNSSRVEFFLTVKIRCPAGVLPGTLVRSAEQMPASNGGKVERDASAPAPAPAAEAGELPAAPELPTSPPQPLPGQEEVQP